MPSEIVGTSPEIKAVDTPISIRPHDSKVIPVASIEKPVTFVGAISLLNQTQLSEALIAPRPSL